MGPALKQLFETVKQEPVCDDADVLVGIFEHHGEALIAALEEAYCIIDEHVPGHTVWLERAKQLLAQLDSEAQR